MAGEHGEVSKFKEKFEQMDGDSLDEFGSLFGSTAGIEGKKPKPVGKAKVDAAAEKGAANKKTKVVAKKK